MKENVNFKTIFKAKIGVTEVKDKILSPKPGDISFDSKYVMSKMKMAPNFYYRKCSLQYRLIVLSKGHICMPYPTKSSDRLHFSRTNNYLNARS